MSSRLIPCLSCGEHRFADESTCRACERSGGSRTSRSAMIAAALGISLSVGVALSTAGCESSPAASHYDGPPIKESGPVAPEPVPLQDTPDMSADIGGGEVMLPAAVYGAPPVEDDPKDQIPIQEEPE